MGPPEAHPGGCVPRRLAGRMRAQLPGTLGGRVARGYMAIFDFVSGSRRSSPTAYNYKKYTARSRESDVESEESSAEEEAAEEEAEGEEGEGAVCAPCPA